MIWCRVDNRLVHGQVVEAWLPYLGASFLVVANDAVAGDYLQRQIMQLAIPARINAFFSRIAELPLLLKDLETAHEKGLILFADCADVWRAVQGGFKPTVLNVGNLHYGPDKKQVCTHVALSQGDAECLDRLKSLSVNLDFRCVPDDLPQVEDWNAPV